MKFRISQWDLRPRSRPTPGIEVSIRLDQVDRDDARFRFWLTSLTPRAMLKANACVEWLDVRVTRMLGEPISHDGNFPLKLVLETPFDLLERLEMARAGGSEVILELQLDATVTTLIQAMADIPNAERRAEHVPVFSPQQLHSDKLAGQEHRIHRDAWLKLLGGIGFREVLVVEFARPVLGAAQGAVAIGAREKLASARDSFDRADYDHVCADVQTALENLATPGKGELASRLIDGAFQHVTPAVRGRLREALNGTAPLIHFGRHAGKTDEERRETVTREHAALLLAWVTLVVGWAEQGPG